MASNDDVASMPLVLLQPPPPMPWTSSPCGAPTAAVDVTSAGASAAAPFGFGGAPQPSWLTGAVRPPLTAATSPGSSNTSSSNITSSTPATADSIGAQDSSTWLPKGYQYQQQPVVTAAAEPSLSIVTSDAWNIPNQNFNHHQQHRPSIVSLASNSSFDASSYNAYGSLPSEPAWIQTGHHQPQQPYQFQQHTANLATESPTSSSARYATSEPSASPHPFAFAVLPPSQLAHQTHQHQRASQPDEQVLVHQLQHQHLTALPSASCAAAAFQQQQQQQRQHQYSALQPSALGQLVSPFEAPQPRPQQQYSIHSWTMASGAGDYAGQMGAGSDDVASFAGMTSLAGPSSAPIGQSAMSPPPPKKKRAKAGVKITRNRKITSCIPCRERKQKCDRNHPICQKCVEDGRKCFYMDQEDSNAAANEASSEWDRSKKMRAYDESSPNSSTETHAAGTDPRRPSSSLSEDFLERRRKLIAATYRAGRDRKLPFEDRVKAARAAAIAEVLFAEDGAADVKRTGNLRLPTRAQAEPLLEYFKRDVEAFLPIFILDLNRTRIYSFLDWWHSNPLTVPPEADAPLAPLVLVVLGLAVQAKRTRDAVERKADGIPSSSFFTHNDSIFPWISSERFLLEKAGRCINALQIACPSSWASAYSAPLDIVKAEALRAVWHIGESHLQFASSTIAVAMRLAYAAGLHRDPKHWNASGMSDYEIQARRATWWNLVVLEVFHSHKTSQPSGVVNGSYDAELPADYGKIVDHYKSILGSSSAQLPKMIFECAIARMSAAQILAAQPPSISGLFRGPKAAGDNVRMLFRNWMNGLPEPLREQLDYMLYEAKMPERVSYEEASWDIFYLAIAILQGEITSNRPYSDLSTGYASSPAEAMRSMEACLDAASRMISICHNAVSKRPSPPFLVLNYMIYHVFNAGCMLAVQLHSLPSLCRPAHAKGLFILDYLANNEALCNVSEQAERCASAIREIAANAQQGRLSLSANQEPSKYDSVRRQSTAKMEGAATNRQTQQGDVTSKGSSFAAPSTEPLLAQDSIQASPTSSVYYTRSEGSSAGPDASNAAFEMLFASPTVTSGMVDNVFVQSRQALEDRPWPGNHQVGPTSVGNLFPDELMHGWTAGPQQPVISGGVTGQGPDFSSLSSSNPYGYPQYERGSAAAAPTQSSSRPPAQGGAMPTNFPLNDSRWM